MTKAIEDALEKLGQAVLAGCKIEVDAYNDAGEPLDDDNDDLRVRLRIPMADGAWDVAISLSLKEQLTAYARENRDENLMVSVQRLRAIGLHVLALAQQNEDLVKAMDEAFNGMGDEAKLKRLMRRREV